MPYIYPFSNFHFGHEDGQTEVVPTHSASWKTPDEWLLGDQEVKIWAMKRIV
jgi:hypothetical protein